VICQVWKEEVIPEQCEEGLTCHIYKKGDQLQPGNYRDITLLNTNYKIFSNILYERLEPYVDKTVGNYQCGFRVASGKNTGIQSQHISPFH
jgi:hypothetical protein